MCMTHLYYRETEREGDSNTVVLSVLGDQVIGVIYAVVGTQSLLWLGRGVVCPFISQEEEFGKVWQILLPASKLKS